VGIRTLAFAIINLVNLTKSGASTQEGLWMRNTETDLNELPTYGISDMGHQRWSVAFNTTIDDSANKVNFKAAMFLKMHETCVYTKAGTINAGGPVGQTLQSIGSAVTPGNISKLRSPVRSRLYSMITPGGPRIPGANIPGARGASRCPAGFAFGGRFTDNEFSTCGAQLFDIPSPIALAIRALRRVNNVPTAARVENLSDVIEGGTSPDRLSQIRRMAQIPKNGTLNAQSLGSSVRTSITALKGAPAGEGRMIRRDGTILRPIVPSSVLRTFSGNPDMEDGVMVRAMQVPKDISSDDLALLAGAGIQQVSFVAPNGTQIGVKRVRDLTVGERRKFGRQLNNVVGQSDDYDVGSNLREFTTQTDGAFEYTQDFPTVKNPTETVSFIGKDGRKHDAPRWVYETFFKKGKPKQSTATESTDLRDPFTLPAGEIVAAITTSKNYKGKRVGRAMLLERVDGKSFMLLPQTVENGSLSRQIYSDVAKNIGVKMPQSKLVGTAGMRQVLQEDEIASSRPKAIDYLGVLFADVLLDKRNRSDKELFQSRDGKWISFPTGNELSAGAGLSKEDIERRFNIDLPEEMLSSYRDYGKAFANLSDRERQLLTVSWDDLLRKARSFDWAKYIARLNSDGILSSAERAHVDVVRRLYDRRLANLSKLKERFLELVKIA